MAELGWLEKADRPRGMDELRALSHREFEAFAIDVVRCLYEPQGIILRPTRAGPDGGRDGDAAIRFGVLEQHAVELLLWVEVKHHKERVGRKVSGGHLVAAMNAAANILVLVSSSGFTLPFRAEVEQFSLRTGMRAVLIDGTNLLAIAEELEGRRAAPGGAPVSLPSAPVTPNMRVRAVHFAVSAAPGGDPSSRPLLIDDRTPVFAVIQYEFRLGSGCCNIDVDISCTATGIDLRTISSRSVLSAGADERLTSILLLRGEPGARVSASDLRVWAVAARAGGQPCEASAAWQPEPGAPVPEVQFTASGVQFQSTADQRTALSRARDVYVRWKAEGGVSSLSVEAAAGVGKSALLRELRWSWLEDGVREIVVDGAIENSVWSLFSAILAHLLPTDGALARTFDIRSVRDWFEQLAAPSAVATRLARAICGKAVGDQSFSPGELEDVLAAMLRKLARQGPLTIVYEDLHKVGGGVLRLLHATRERLRAERNVQILFCLTSRFQAQATADAPTEGWTLERERLLGDEQSDRLRLDMPSETDARAILEGAIPYLYPEVADLILARAGTTPFALTELIRFLLERRCLERVGTPEVLRVDPSADLKSELQRPELIARTATDQRLALIAQRLTPAGRDLLDAAACLGREFEPGFVLQRTGSAIESEDAVDALLGGLFRDGIVGPAPRSFGNRWRFEHDIIREAVLRRLVAPEHRPRHLRLLRRLGPEDPSWPAPVALALAYQSGDGDAFVARAKSYASDQRRAGYPYEAAFYLTLENYVLDPLAPAAAFEDAAYRTSPRPILSKAAPAAALLDTKMRLYEMSVVVTGAAGEFAKRIITEVRMLSERVGDVAASAMAVRWEGDLWIAQGDDQQAVDCYREAERLYGLVPETRTVDLFQTVLGQGIALRLLGETQQSEAELQRALALSPDDPFAQIRYHANYGALFFYSDAEKRRKHWEAALSIAVSAGFDDLQVHMDGDVAGLDIMEDRPGARARVERLIEAAADRRLDDSLVRALIMASAIDLIERKPDDALSRLDEARRLGYANDTKRRLWKIHANSAIAHETKGDLDRAYEEDRVMLGVLSAVAWERRIALAPANVVLRARDHPDEPRFRVLSQSIPSAARSSVDMILAAIHSGTPLTGRFPQEHLRQFATGARFIAV